MNNIGYYLMPNPTDTASTAPYLPKLVPNGVANLNDIAKKIAASLPVGEERAKLLVRESFGAALEMALRCYTVDLGALRMKARIPGSMPCEDTPFDAEANACVIELYADGELSDALDALKPTKLTAAQVAGAIKVSNVMDVETEHMGEIAGGDAFMVLGNGVTLDGEGEGAKLLDRKTDEVLSVAAVESVTRGQRATCTLVPGGEEVPVGAYALEVTTRGLVGETTPRVFRKAVRLTKPLAAPVPTITKIESQDYGGLCRGFDVNVRGENLSFDAARGDSVEVTCTDEDGETHTGTVPASAVEDDGSGTLLVLKSPEGCAVSDLAKSDTMVTFKVTIGGKVLEHETECLGS